ncbi:MAG: DHH family phosphoesterase [Bacteroidales bacterium]|nr:DHH family phosphoesterase [Bacteroidales bacterium]
MDAICFDNQHLESFRTFIDEARRIVIVAHRNADGDAVGSSLGLWHMLCQQDKQVTVMLPNGCPNTFSWLPCSSHILNGDLQPEDCKEAMSAADLLIGTDFNQLSRIATLSQPFADAHGKKVLIDHHENPDREAFDIVFSYPKMSSASELCYWISSRLWGSDCLTTAAATCFYTGIRTDTGGLSFSCDQPSLYQAVGDLVGRNIDPARLNHYISDNFTASRLRFYAFALSERLKIFEDYHFAYFFLSQDDLQHYDIVSSELEGLVNYALMISNIEVGVLIREEPERIKLSFRSKFDTNVEKIAREEFGGGGHFHASGADSMNMSFQEVIKKVESIFLKASIDHA